MTAKAVVVGMPDAANAWQLDVQRQALAHAWPQCGIECVATIDSTNTELMRRLRTGDGRPTLLLAQHQSAGRGRMGRPWHSSAPAAADELPGSLTFSLSVPLAPSGWSGLSLAVGMALAGSLHDGILLKWPNDLWWQERKLAGILIETASIGELRHVVIGIGVNISRRDGAGLARAPAWVQEFLPELNAASVLSRVLPALARAVCQFEEQGLSPFLDGCRARDVLRGRAVELSDGTVGVAQGLAENGALLVHTLAGMKSITSAEVSVRPAVLANAVAGFLPQS
ncbi:MAG: biotin--[acetyl-CoA-carboxylase] ligase [Rhodoferax sp.]|nr:biotin--[acetyl-CoA-carboxylase] ligase [Rhodoferax sp.]